MPRFVVLGHRWNGVHFDVMLERGSVLRTWAIDAPIVPQTPQRARSLPDHRLIYLDYEGPISGGRGEVRRIFEGTYNVVVWSDDRVVVDLASDQLSGCAEFGCDGGGVAIRSPA